MNNNRFKAEGYVSVMVAAKMLGASYPFVRRCFEDGRLKFKVFKWKVRDVYMADLASVNKLKPQLTQYGDPLPLNTRHLIGARRNYVGIPKNPAPRRPTLINGYRYIHKPEHHRANQHGYVPEHYLVAEKMLKRKLTKTEVVHHRNHVRDDNSPKNLIVYSNHGDHMKAEHSEFMKYVWEVRGRQHIEQALIKLAKKLLAEEDS